MPLDAPLTTHNNDIVIVAISIRVNSGVARPGRCDQWVNAYLELSDRRIRTLPQLPAIGVSAPKSVVPSDIKAVGCVLL